MHRNKQQVIKNMELLIVDEVSMLRADVLDAMDFMMQFIRKDRRPFGGVQVLFIGDLLQLPPVVKQEEWEVLKHYYTGMYFFQSQVISQHPLLYIELEKIYRQTDGVFISILNHLRDNKLTQEDLRQLASHVQPEFAKQHKNEYITLTTHNNKADAMNQEELEKLPSPLFSYEADVVGDFPEYLYPIEKVIQLKEGARVMFIKNDTSGEHLFFNGKMGTVVALGEKEVSVALDNGMTINVERYEWENVRYKVNDTTKDIEEECLGTFTQYPLRLAWAITIHKSQGLTFSQVKIDFTGGVFAGGQTYVALSRCTAINGITLQEPLRRDEIFVRSEVTNFSRNYNNETALQTALQQSKADRQYHDAVKAFDKGDMAQCLDNFFLAIHSRYDIERPGPRRYIRKKLNIINLLREKNTKLQAKLKQQEDYLRKLAVEYVLMGKECEREGMKEAALRNYNKALELCPDIPEAKRKVRKLSKKEK